MNQPGVATAIDERMSSASCMCPASANSKRSPPSGSSTGSSQRWNQVGWPPPNISGKPTKPPITARMARIQSTPVMLHGDSGKQQGQADRGHVLAQTAHLAHVLLAAAAVDHRAGTEEETGLEEGVGHDMENRRGERADARGQEHESELRDRRVGQHFLDV